MRGFLSRGNHNGFAIMLRGMDELVWRVNAGSFASGSHNGFAIMLHSNGWARIVGRRGGSFANGNHNGFAIMLHGMDGLVLWVTAGNGWLKNPREEDWRKTMAPNAKYKDLLTIPRLRNHPRMALTKCKAVTIFCRLQV
jgi:hypothetical protein